MLATGSGSGGAEHEYKPIPRGNRVPGFVVRLSRPAGALGDSPCNTEIRDVTAAERAQITTVLQTAQSALPPAPKGWIIVDRYVKRDIGPVQAVSRPRDRPWNYGFSRTYRQVCGRGDAQQASLIGPGSDANRPAMKQRQPRLEAMQQKMQAIMQQQMALNQKRDYAGAEKLQPQLEAAQKEYEEVINEASDPAAKAAADKALSRDREMTIGVRVNPRNERSGRSDAVAPPAGGKSALRWHVEERTRATITPCTCSAPGETGRKVAFRRHRPVSRPRARTGSRSTYRATRSASPRRSRRSTSRRSRRPSSSAPFTLA